MKSKLFYLPLIALFALPALNLPAQVTIGTGATPPSYSILEIDAANLKAGLHLPKLTSDERDALQALLDVDALGLVIFNITTHCTETWDGEQWISQCAPGNKELDNLLERHGRYDLYGKILFDAHNGTVAGYPAPYNQYPTDYPHSCDFLPTGQATTANYTFRNILNSSYSGLQFGVSDPNNLLTSWSATNNILTFTFKDISVIQGIVGNATRTNAKKILITATFIDNNNETRKVTLTVRVQKAPVACAVRKVNDPALASPTVNGWQSFLCFNLGSNQDYADPAASIAYVPVPNIGYSTDATVYGDLYQWGRIPDGHQFRPLKNSDLWPDDHIGQTTGFTPDPAPTGSLTSDPAYANHQVKETDPRFGKFIRRNGAESPAGNWDWIAGTTANNMFPDRWGAAKTLNDPCPMGWRVPTRNEWAAIYGTITNTTGATAYTGAKVNQWVADFAATNTSLQNRTHGVQITPSSTQGGSTYTSPVTLFLPAGDDRNGDHATMDNQGAYSIYWSSTPATTTPYYSFTLHCRATLVYPGYEYPRSYGHSVRCISE
jgi:uncharacterized protein (TIGR02145 family)